MALAPRHLCRHCGCHCRRGKRLSIKRQSHPRDRSRPAGNCVGGEVEHLSALSKRLDRLRFPSIAARPPARHSIRLLQRRCSGANCGSSTTHAVPTNGRNGQSRLGSTKHPEKRLASRHQQNALPNALHRSVVSATQSGRGRQAQGALVMIFWAGKLPCAPDDWRVARASHASGA